MLLQFVQQGNLSERLDSFHCRQDGLRSVYEIVISFAFFTETVQPGSRRQAAYPDASEQHIAHHVQKRRFALSAVG